MKKVPLRKVPIVVLGQEQEFSYKDMLQVIMENPQDITKGAAIDEVRKSIRVLDVLERSENSMELEDSDYEYMMSKVRTTKFSSANKVFVEFVEDLEKAGKDV